MLLLWLSIACMIPFDMSRLDGTFGIEKGEKRKPVVDRIMDIAKVIHTMSVYRIIVMVSLENKFWCPILSEWLAIISQLTTSTFD